MSVEANYPFSLVPIVVPEVHTQYRVIKTALPVPESILIIKNLLKNEPRSMAIDQLPVIWDRAEGFQVYDPYGNKWLDFTSGIFVANVGHSHPEIIKAIMGMISKPLLHNYYHPTEVRAKLVSKLVEMSPEGLDMVFLLTTGAEATECCMKLARINGRRKRPDKVGIVSLTLAFHGKTLGAQSASGRPGAKTWMGAHTPNFHQIPVPFCPRCPWGKEEYQNCGKECFLKGMEKLASSGVDLETVAAFIFEPYQGWSAAFHPDDFIAAMRTWADEHEALLISDEVQAGFCRTGKFLAFEHFNVPVDLVACGKGISSSLPLSAVLGRRELLDVDPSLNSTHGGNPVCCAAALANLEVMQRQSLAEIARKTGSIFGDRLKEIAVDYPEHIFTVQGRGFLWGVHMVNPETEELDVRLADEIVEKLMRKGMLIVRTGVGTLKFGPPLCISEDAIIEGVGVVQEVLAETIRARNRQGK